MMFGQYLLHLIFLVALSNHHIIAKPTEDESKKLTLDIPKEILNATSIRVPTRWEKGMELLGQLMDAIRFGTGRIVNFGMIARNEIANRAEELTSEAANALLSLIAARDARQYIQMSNKKNESQQHKKRSTLETLNKVSIKPSPVNDIPPRTGREKVHLENENAQGLLEAPKPILLRDLLPSLNNNTPVVDSTLERDKYGNHGGTKDAISDPIKGISSLVNSLLQIPGKAVKNFSISIQKALNHVGERLIGLA